MDIINNSSIIDFESLEDITYNKFMSNRLIYSSKSKAACKGFAAHHIVPICLQGVDRRDKSKDDRCVRLTYFEHIVAHYLLAREYRTPELLYSFFCMVHTDDYKLTDMESITISQLMDFAKLMEKAKKEYSKLQIKEWKDPIKRKEMSNLKKQQYIDNPELSDPQSKNFIIITPNGEYIEGKNLRRWCRESGLFENWKMASVHLTSRGYYKKYVSILYEDNDENIDIEQFKKNLWENHIYRTHTKNELHSNGNKVYEILNKDGSSIQIDSLELWAKEHNCDKRGKERLLNNKDWNGYTLKRISTRKGCSMTWKIICPEGQEIITYNLMDWIREMNIGENIKNISVYLKRGKGYKGYKAEKII